MTKAESRTWPNRSAGRVGILRDPSLVRRAVGETITETIARDKERRAKQQLLRLTKTTTIAGEVLTFTPVNPSLEEASWSSEEENSDEYPDIDGIVQTTKADTAADWAPVKVPRSSEAPSRVTRVHSAACATEGGRAPRHLLPNSKPQKRQVGEEFPDLPSVPDLPTGFVD